MTSPRETSAVDACWRRIGTSPGGDRRCSRLREVAVCSRCEVFAEAARSLLERPVETRDADVERHPEVERHSAEVTGLAVETEAVFVVRVGTERLGLPISACRRVLAGARRHRGPGTGPAGLQGLANADGRLVPLVDPAPLLDAGPAAGASEHMVLLDVEGRPAAMAVDHVEGVVEVLSRDLRAAPAGSAAGVRGVTRDGDGLVTVVDPARLFGPLLGGEP